MSNQARDFTFSPPNQKEGGTLFIPNREDEDISPYFQCKCCGVHIDIRDYRRAPLKEMMLQEKLCYSCAYWVDIINNPPLHSQIINGRFLTFNPWETEISVFDADGKESFYIMQTDGDVRRSNNVWFQGEVPERFRNLLPDTARYISKDLYYKVKKHPFFKCQSKGCWDRYHCYWYDTSLEANGPWNLIPASHQIGDECCESFLNKATVE